MEGSLKDFCERVEGSWQMVMKRRSFLSSFYHAYFEDWTNSEFQSHTLRISAVQYRSRDKSASCIDLYFC